MSYSIRFTERAKRHLSELDAWWSENRPDSEAEVVSEVGAAITLLRDMPTARAVYKRRRGREIRRSRLENTPYFIYYTVDSNKDEVVIVAVWSGPRGKDPPL